MTDAVNIDAQIDDVLSIRDRFLEYLSESPKSQITFAGADSGSGDVIGFYRERMQEVMRKYQTQSERPKSQIAFTGSGSGHDDWGMQLERLKEYNHKSKSQQKESEVKTYLEAIDFLHSKDVREKLHSALKDVNNFIGISSGAAALGLLQKLLPEGKFNKIHIGVLLGIIASRGAEEFSAALIK